MKIKSVRYQRTSRLVNHETETVDSMAMLEQGENPDEVFHTLKSYVLSCLDIKQKTAMQIAMEEAKERN